MTTVSVIISTCNRYESLTDTLRSVLSNTVKPDEILVVDQSDDRNRMRSIIEALGSQLVKCIYLDRKGAALGRNAGLRACSGEIIAFTDDDAYVREDWLERTLETFSASNYKCGIASGKIVPVYEERNPNWSIPSQWEYVLPAYSQDGPLAPFSGGYPPLVNYAIRRELIDAVGYFDEMLGPQVGRKNQLFGEDTHYTLRTLAAGYQVLYNPESIVFHPVPMSRQTQQFLNSRLFCKGLTDIAVRYRLAMPNKSQMVSEFVKTCLKAIKLEVAKPKDRRVLEGKRALMKGQLAMLKAYIRHPDAFESDLF